MKQTRLLLGLMLLATAALAYAAGDVEAGRSKSGLCAGCHGQDGNSLNPIWPKLAGQHAKYIAKQLHDFKSKDRNDVTMGPMAAGLSDQDIEDVAAFFSSNESSIQAADADKIALGEKLYRGGNPVNGLPACIACHGPNGAVGPTRGSARRICGSTSDAVREKNAVS
jgi:cytochrome c553